MAGDRETGVTIFRITAGLDSGPVALAAAEPIHPGDTAGTLSARLAVLGGALLVEALDRAEGGTLELIEQDEDASTYASKIVADERRLDPQRSAAELERVVRALTPAVGAYIAFPGGERLGVCAARAVEETVTPGELRATDRRVLVGCGEGALELLEVRPPGGRAMPAADYLRGHRLPERVES
jgi:methionyl-tRNA formyltransferase